MKNKILLITMVLAIIASVSILLFAMSSTPEKGAIYYSITIYITYFFMAVALLAAVIFPLLYAAKNLKSARGAFIGIGVLILVLLISYLIASPEQGEFYTKLEVSPQQSKLVGAGLIATYIFLAGALLSTIYSAISERFK